MAKTIQEALAEVQRKLNEDNTMSFSNEPAPIRRKPASQGATYNPGSPVNQATGFGVGGASSNYGPVTSSSAQRPVPRPLPRPATTAAPRPAPSAAPSGPSNADIYAKHGVGGSDESAGAFARAEADIAARNKAAPSTAPTARPTPSAAPRPAGGNPDVLKQQQQLISQGAKIKADGIMGPQTRAAIEAQNKTDSMKMGRGATTTTTTTSPESKPTTPSGIDPNDKRESPLPGASTTKGVEAGYQTAGKLTAFGAQRAAERAAASKSVTSDIVGRPETDTKGKASFGNPNASSTTTGVASQTAPEKDKQDKLNAVPTEPSIGSRISDAASSLANKVKSALPTADDTKDIPESGPSKGKKKMSESAIINAFLKLQETKHSNIFEAAKKAKKDWDGDGKIESGKDEYLGSRIAAAKKAGKMEEELKGDQDKIDANKNGKIDSDDFRKLRSGKKSEKMKAYRADRDKHGEMEEEVESLDERNAANKMKKNAAAMSIGSKNKDDQHLSKTGMRTDVADKIRGREVLQGKNRQQYEEVEFSEEELAHFEAVIARKDQKGKERGIGDTVASEDLTDEYINEMARGVKAGTKRGSYKGKTHRGGISKAEASSEPAEEPKGVPHVLDQIRHGREDEHGFKTITHPASSPEAPVTKSIHRSELHGFYDKYHNTEKPAAKEKEYSGFLDKHFGDSRTSAPTSQSVTTDLSKVEKANLKGGAGKVSLGGSKLVGGSKKEW